MSLEYTLQDLQISNPPPFNSRYIKERILKYGKAYSNYKTYQIINNINNINNTNNTNNTNQIQTIYIDNAPCKYTLFTSSLSYFVEIHYTIDANLQPHETIMKDYEITQLLEQYTYIML